VTHFKDDLNTSENDPIILELKIRKYCINIDCLNFNFRVILKRKLEKLVFRKHATTCFNVI